MTQTKIIFTPHDKMKDLINENNLLLMVISRFGISLGFAEKTVDEVCKDHNVDCSTFLSVANFISRKEYKHEVSLSSLMGYLKKAHNYFLDFNLPSIRRKLIEALDCCTECNEISMLIIKFYDNYAMEVRKHMMYENNVVFTYVDGLLDGKLSKEYDINYFASRHNHIDTKLKELKDIIIRYYPQKDNNLLNAVLFDIMNCEQDLILHCQVEDYLFVPIVLELENKIKNSPSPSYGTDSRKDPPKEEQKIETLSDREKEIVACIAKGMSYKEIADQLCLSIHTVNTHRRNISNKLEIHSAAGLTIFAIVNKLVKLEDIKHLI